MAVEIKAIKYWRGVVENKPGVLAGILGPLAAAGLDLKVVMGYRMHDGQAAIELYPVIGKKSMAVAQAAGMSVHPVPALLVHGDDKPGVGSVMAKALSEAGINIAFMVAQVIGRRYSAVIAFENDADTRKAAGVIKKATAPKKK